MGVPLPTTTVTGGGNDLRGAPNHVDQLDQVSQSLAVGLPGRWACMQHPVTASYIACVHVQGA